MSDDSTTGSQSDQTDDQSLDTQQDELGEKGQAAIKAERDARKKAERDLKVANTRLAEIDSADKSDAEKTSAALKAAEERATAAELRLRDANARVAVSDAATNAKAISVRAVYALIRDDLEFDDDGEPTNVDALVKASIKAEPSLFRAANGSGDGGVTSSTAQKEYASNADLLSAGYAQSSKARR